MCTPMGQQIYKLPEQAFPRSEYEDFFKRRGQSYTGFDFSFLPRATFDDTPEQRQKQYEELWAEGDFKFWMGTYHDMLFSKEANFEAYRFWRDKTRAKIQDTQVADLLAPMEPPHPFGCKRVSLELNYFEIFNEPHVTLIDTSDKGTPIQEITEKGIKTTETEHEFDVILCATGYDFLTGSLTQIDIRGSTGEGLGERWKDGVKTYLGLSMSGFPNVRSCLLSVMRRLLTRACAALFPIRPTSSNRLLQWADVC
jgi:cation diffusion facilitator CzcD-associated flavoprotein CzcO